MKIFIKIVFLCLVIFSSSVFAQEAQKIYEFENVNCESYLAIMDNVMVESMNNPSAKIYVIIYQGKQRVFNNKSSKYELLNPVFGIAKAEIYSMKKRLEFRKVSTDNFIFIAGGFRKELAVEFWLVAPGAKIPQPTPTLTKMKYRKGKPVGFCLGCC